MSHTLERGQGEEDGPNGIAACEPWTLGLQPNPHQRTLRLIATEGFIVFGIVQHTSKLKDRYVERCSKKFQQGVKRSGCNGSISFATIRGPSVFVPCRRCWRG